MGSRPGPWPDWPGSPSGTRERSRGLVAARQTPNAPAHSSMRRRVVVTGIGAITPIGITGQSMWDGVRSERSAVRSLTRFDPSIFRSHNAAEVNDFVPSDHLEAKRAKR